MTRLPQLPANELESVDDAGVAFRIMRMKEGPMMTKLPALPANYYEAFADDWIVEHRKPNGVFHVDAEEIYGKELMKHWMRQCPGFGPDDVFYFAENGNEQAHNALVEMYAEYRQRREDPPVSVEAYAIRVLNNGRKKPGPGRAALFVRDIGICFWLRSCTKGST